MRSKKILLLLTCMALSIVATWAQPDILRVDQEEVPVRHFLTDGRVWHVLAKSAYGVPSEYKGKRAETFIHKLVDTPTEVEGLLWYPIRVYSNLRSEETGKILYYIASDREAGIEYIIQPVVTGEISFDVSRKKVLFQFPTEETPYPEAFFLHGYGDPTQPYSLEFWEEEQVEVQVCDTLQSRRAITCYGTMMGEKDPYHSEQWIEGVG